MRDSPERTSIPSDIAEKYQPVNKHVNSIRYIPGGSLDEVMNRALRAVYISISFSDRFYESFRDSG